MTRPCWCGERACLRPRHARARRVSATSPARAAPRPRDRRRAARSHSSVRAHSAENRGASSTDGGGTARAGVASASSHHRCTSDPGAGGAGHDDGAAVADVAASRSGGGQRRGQGAREATVRRSQPACAPARGSAIVSGRRSRADLTDEPPAVAQLLSRLEVWAAAAAAVRLLQRQRRRRRQLLQRRLRPLRGCPPRRRRTPTDSVRKAHGRSMRRPGRGQHRPAPARRATRVCTHSEPPRTAARRAGERRTCRACR